MAQMSYLRESKEKSMKDLFKISKVVYNEAFLEGYLNSAGQQREKYIEKLEKNSKSVRNNGIFTKIFSSIMIVAMGLTTFFSLDAFSEIIGTVNEFSFSVYLFTITMPVTITFATQFLFLFTYGISSLTGIFDGSAYRYLKTLPMSEREIRKVLFMSLFRALNVQLLMMFLILPVATSIYMPGVLSILVSILVSALNLIFSLSLMIIIANYMANKVYKLESTSRKQTIVKIIITILYMVTAMTAGLLTSYVYEIVSNLFMSSLAIGDTGLLYNQILSFVLWPFALSYTYGLSLFPNPALGAYFNQYWTVLLGIVISIGFILLIFKKALYTLGRVLKDDITKASSVSEEFVQEDVGIKIESHVKAIISKDMKYFLRNFQAMIYLIMPMLLPIVGIISMSASVELDAEALLVTNIVNIFYYCMSVIFLIVAITGAENETGGLLYSLPIKNIDVYKAKKKIMEVCLLVSLIVPTIIQITKSPALTETILINTLTLAITSLYCCDIGLILYSVFFGHIRGKYKIQMIHLDKKSIKTTIAGLGVIVGLALPTAVMIIYAIIADIPMENTSVFQIPLIISLILFVVFRRLAAWLFNK